jgi:hypothetical protein
MSKGTEKYWIGWVIALIVLLIFLSVLIIWPNNILVSKILDTINVIIKIREVGP